MNQLVRTTLKLEQYQCRRCGRFFYINKMDKSELDFDFGCPYGCDDNGKLVRDIETNITQVKDIPQSETNEDGKTPQEQIKDYTITITLSEEDFKQSMGREPKTQEEFDKWAYLAEKGLLNGQVDWDIVYECTKDTMSDFVDGDKNESG